MPIRGRRPALLRCALGRLMLAVLAGLTGCAAGDAGRPAGADGGSGPRSGGTVAFAVVGDSITAGLGPALTGTRIRGTGSWVPAAAGAPLDFRGGWAVPGATTADMRAGVGPVEADVLVLMAGTNDVALRYGWPEIRRNLLAVGEQAGVADVLVAAIPPLDPSPDDALAHNRRLRELADDRGWAYVDPWAGAGGDGRFAPGASEDGVHPTQEVADRAGRVIREALLDSVASAGRRPR